MDPTKEESLTEKHKKYFENFDLVEKKEENAKQESFKKMSRKRDIRKLYPGYACSCCKDYYQCLNLNQEQLKLRLKKVSRHRRPSPPKSPEHFWELGFPSEEECLKRGYIEPPKPYYFQK